MDHQHGFIEPLRHLGLIAVDGEDAASFLHNQLTNDVLGLDQSGARLAGYCSPKGRLLATMLVWQSSGRILLALPRDILPAVQKRLQMFILRSRVRLSDISEAESLLGVAGSAVSVLQPYFPELPEQPYAMARTEAGTLIRLPDASGLSRYQWITQQQLANDALVQSQSKSEGSLWRWTEIMAGMPQITLATQEKFVPQMINFELIGGVNFRKGCYPGQEIVARSQYLGKFKRRMLLATADSGDASAGAEIFTENDPGQPCGMVVNAERGPEGKLACLVEIKLDAIDQPVHLGAANGPLLNFAPLPYALPEPG